MPSAVIAGISYSSDTQVLEITFRSGSVYLYAGVPEEVYLAFRHARSKGRYFNRFIKDQYNFRQVA